MWLLLFLHAIFASTFTLGKAGLAYAQPIFYVALRLLGCGVILLCYQWFINRTFFIKRNHVWLVVQIGFFQMYLSFVLEFAVLRNIDSAKWSLLYSVAPFMTMVFSYLHFGEKITSKKIIGLIVGFLALVPILFIEVEQEQMFGMIGVFSVPELAVLTSMISYSYGMVLSQRLVRDEGYGVALVVGMSMMLGGILSLITSPCIDSWQPSPILEVKPFVFVLIAIIVAHTFVVSINTYLLRFYSVTFLVFLSFVDPLYVALYGRLFLGEIVTWHFFVSVFGIFCGLYLFYREEQR